MMAGTAGKQKYISVNDVCRNLPAGSMESLLPFHALTGCDTTSHFFGHTKKSAWTVFLKHHDLLMELGVGPLNDSHLKHADSFVCKMYGVDNVDLIMMCVSANFPRPANRNCSPNQWLPWAAHKACPLPVHGMEASSLSCTSTTRCKWDGMETWWDRPSPYSDGPWSNHRCLSWTDIMQLP